MSVEFDPVRIGSRRRRLDPLAVGAALVVVALAVAVVKPWESTGKVGGVPAGIGRSPGERSSVGPCLGTAEAFAPAVDACHLGDRGGAADVDRDRPGRRRP